MMNLNQFKENKPVVIGSVWHTNVKTQSSVVYDLGGVSPTLCRAMGESGTRTPLVVVKTENHDE